MSISFSFIKYLAVMAGVTYLIRMLPLVLIKKKLKNRFLKSFLYYIPYAVLSVMTVPAIFTSTGSVVSATAGFVTAVILAYFERGLLTVAAFSCAAVFIAELFMRLAL
ncbi:MAG: AzlD domain-containing protein [Clostridia bacterium]|nr:AzlD domain-containing protein [Clostridia bacterium]